MDKNFKEFVPLSFLDSVRLTERERRIHDELARAIFDGFVEDQKTITHEVNKALYEFAEKNGMNLYDLCYECVPSVQPVDMRVSGMDIFRPQRTTEYEIKLIPLKYEFSKDGGYWKEKYFALKKKMQALIDDKDDDEQVHHCGVDAVVEKK
ncbi:hypothetical protein L6468_08975 [Prevotella communis]|uniref:hypothetical protein n=1 Tax=Prevotella communis TaxID=2913614 RepID=UPI001EDAECA2|nr:hypothetical protein [Prevotella communis]UKK61137.1 hypothetical protein L6468_08975 [Prevotella communis]UKK63961.1 hypothetical protein L6473_08980 [Prevotella communis]